MIFLAENLGFVLIALVVISTIEALFVARATQVVAKLKIGFSDALKPVFLVNTIALAVGCIVLFNGGDRGTAVIAFLIANLIAGTCLYGKMIRYPATMEDSRSESIGYVNGVMVWGMAALLKFIVVLLMALRHETRITLWQIQF